MMIFRCAAISWCFPECAATRAAYDAIRAAQLARELVTGAVRECKDESDIVILPRLIDAIMPF